MTTLTPEQITAFENGAKAMEALKTEILPLKGQLDACQQTKFQTKVFETSPIRQLASVITIGTDTYEVITDNDQASFSWVGETQSRSETSTPTLGKLVITVNEMAAKPKITQKMLDDASIDVEA